MQRVLLPWLVDPWTDLRAYLLSGRVPHALLIQGPSGTGKTTLARCFADRLLCTADAGEFACGRCGACRLLGAGTHPDLLLMESVDAGKPIKVDMVRDMIAALSLRPQYGHNRVVLVPSAHLMNRHAANSLLKTLEEPDSQTKFLLLTEMPGAVPATIRSRCQRVFVRCPPRSLTAEWLRQQSPPVGDIEARVVAARGAPLHALALDATELAARRGILESFAAVLGGGADPVAIAGQWEKFGTDAVVACLIAWLEDLIRMRSGSGIGETRPPTSAALPPSLAGSVTPISLYGCLDRALRAKRLLASQVNRQMLLEELAMACSRASSEA